jgi:iron complex transport system ATP-binding protein
MRLTVDRVSVAYGANRVVHGVSLAPPPGGWIALIGPNGAGKSTLLRAVAQLLPHHGRVGFDGEAAGALTRRRVSQLVAFVPQRPVLPDGMTVADYALLGRTPYIGYLGTESRHDRDVVGTLLDRLELTSLAERPLDSLSGGEVQRAVLARALAQAAPVLLLDEPTAALDVGHQQHVLELIDELRTEHDLTVLSALHDLTLAGQFADRLVMLAGGVVVAEGTAAEVLTEATIEQHYHASVRVEPQADGTVVVLPIRRVGASI